MSEQPDVTLREQHPPGGHGNGSFERFRIAEWTVDPASNQLARGEQAVRLEPKVMEVLVYLASRPGEVVTREELEATVWAGTIVGYDSVTSAIQKLRKAFDDDPKQPRIVETLSKRGYRLVATVSPLDERSRDTQVDAAVSVPSQNQWLPTTLPTLLVLIMVAIGVLWWANPWETADDTVLEESSPKSIAVLPFENLGNDPEQEYFADGITDDLITELAKYPNLLVIARDSTFLYKNRLADKLNVRFILRGSVRREGEQVRVNVQLIEAATESHIWAERYEGRMSSVFEFQDNIARKVGSALVVKVSTGKQQDFGIPLTNNPQAYDNFLYGRQHFYLFANKSENEKAREFFQKAIEFDPDFAMAYAMLAWTHAFEAMNGWSDARESSLQRSQDLATKAITLQEGIPIAHFVSGLAHREMGEHVEALTEAQKAIEYDPNYANGYVLLATLLYYTGRPQEGLERIQKAMLINPHHPYNYTFHLGQAYFILRRYDEAIAAFQQGLATNPAAERLHVWLAAAYAQYGEIDEAEWEADQVLTLNPEFSIQRLQQAFPFRDPADREHFLGGLRKAGLSK
jgi:TolB-like protein/DNA-binding winged helix-turn-helix (wHTH) protein/Tfp pilus assembly protein PilF